MSELATILWLGDASPIKDLPARHIRWPTPQSDLQLPSDVHLIVRRDDDQLEAEWSRVLPRLLPDVPRVMWCFRSEEARLREAVNRDQSFYFFSSRSSVQEWTDILNQARKSGEERRAREKLLAESARRNRELERLTEELEKTVAERTGSLETSMKEEADKLERERHLIRFLSEISMHNAVEEVLRSLRRDLRRFHKVQNLVLALKASGRGLDFFSFRGDQVVHSESSEGDWNFSDETGLRQFFANRFGRPFHRALFFPLEGSSQTGSGETKALGVLCLEYALMDEAEIQDLQEVLQDRLRPLAMVTDRLFLEDRLRRFAVRWEKTFDAFRDPIAVLDSRWGVLRGNKAFSKAHRRSLCYEAFAGRQEPCEGCPVVGRAESQETLSGTVQIGRKTYHLSSWPVKEPDSGQVGGRVHHYADVSEQQELYLRLLQSEKMGAIGKLAGRIAHELNNPLTGIRSLAQALKAETPAGSALADDLQQIEQASQRCQKIIKHLLEFAQGEQGPTRLTNLDEIVESALPLLKSALRPHRQQLWLSARACPIQTEPHLIQQVVFNLVNNACQAMKEPGQIAISTRPLKEPGREARVELRVVDTGPGVPEDLVPRLFEAFFTTKAEGQGTGLGLSTSKAIVEKFGGSLRYERGPSGGAMFIVEFPMVESTP